MVIQHFLFFSLQLTPFQAQAIQTLYRRRIAKVNPKNKMLPQIENKPQRAAVGYFKDLPESFVASSPSKQGKWQVLEEAHGEATMALRAAL